MTSSNVPRSVDLLVIGGGVNGAGIARDASGRGLSVLLCEKDDLAQGTSSRSGKLIHGGLRYLEYGEFRLVREALIEREVLLNLMPHISWPMRFVLPHHQEQRPAWMLRVGLFLYDHLGGRKQLPATRVLDLRNAAEGAPLQSFLHKGFEYSDCWIDDARLVVLNAKGAADNGATILLRTEFVSATTEDGQWAITLRQQDGRHHQVQAKAVVNASGPWVEGTLARSHGVTTRRHVRLVKGSHLVVHKFWDGSQSYLVQNTDRRVIFINPYEKDFALIGTTDIPFDGNADQVAISQEEMEYLCAAVNRYFRHQLKPEDVHSAFSGVRPLFEDEADSPSAVTRDYVLELNTAEKSGQPPYLSIFGGKITTYRKLAEQAMASLRPWFPEMGPPWTSTMPLPGGDIANGTTGGFEVFLKELRNQHPWLPPAMAERLGRQYGQLANQVLGNARNIAALGRDFGANLHEQEIEYLIREEWAQSAEDILWRRTKCGLHMTSASQEALAQWLARRPPAN